MKKKSFLIGYNNWMEFIYLIICICHQMQEFIRSWQISKSRCQSYESGMAGQRGSDKAPSLEVELAWCTIWCKKWCGRRRRGKWNNWNCKRGRWSTWNRRKGCLAWRNEKATNGFCHAIPYQLFVRLSANRTLIQTKSAALGPSIYYVGTFSDIFDPLTFAFINTVLKENKIVFDTLLITM